MFTCFLGLLATGMFSRSDNGDPFTGAALEVTEVDEESQLGLAIGPEVVHKGIPSDCVPSVEFLSGNGDKVDIGLSNSLGLLLRPAMLVSSLGG